ncbi:DUF3800 domain-containing protein [Curtobacterium albidum]|uniref:DUF3800 domain-containing protein n=1 Tax=Curtobacterium citreum TaxID=2036 RepID=UPI002027279E|nr:DUF3800 domain-containing protein [Curtobacterium albidum]MCL9666020.1 DUF3800 domain-containing protein [Curtobacterium albidum]
MLLCFVDESFKRDLYGFAGVVVDADRTKWLTGRLNDLVASLGDYSVPARAEVHAHPVFHGKDVWSALPPRLRVKVFIDVIDAVRHCGATVLLRGVVPQRLARYQDERRFADRHAPEQVAFLHLLQRLDRIAETRGTHALVIADERSDRERHRERFAVYQAYGTPGTYMHTRLERLLDTVHFAPSHHSRMLQVADLIAFVWVRSRTVVETDPRQARTIAQLVDVIERQSVDPGVWP